MAEFRRFFPLLGRLRPVVARPIKAIGKKLFGDTDVDRIRSGNWYGNDTVWRMVVDLNRVLLYADAEGAVHDKPQRRVFSVVDGIVGGEGNGPLDPVAKDAGVVVMGINPVAVDVACARLMGLDYHRLPVLYRAFDEHPLPLIRFASSDVVLQCSERRFTGPVCLVEGLNFLPHFGWRGHVEVDRGAARPIGSPAS